MGEGKRETIIVYIPNNATVDLGDEAMGQFIVLEKKEGYMKMEVNDRVFNKISIEAIGYETHYFSASYPEPNYYIELEPIKEFKEALGNFTQEQAISWVYSEAIDQKDSSKLCEIITKLKADSSNRNSIMKSIELNLYSSQKWNCTAVEGKSILYCVYRTESTSKLKQHYAMQRLKAAAECRLDSLTTNKFHTYDKTKLEKNTDSEQIGPWLDCKNSEKYANIFSYRNGNYIGIHLNMCR